MLFPRSPAYANELSRSYYGTDVPALQYELEQLRRSLRHRSHEVHRNERELKKLQQEHRELKHNYSLVWNELDRVRAKLKYAKARLQGW